MGGLQGTGTQRHNWGVWGHHKRWLQGQQHHIPQVVPSQRLELLEPSKINFPLEVPKQRLELWRVGNFQNFPLKLPKQRLELWEVGSC